MEAVGRLAGGVAHEFNNLLTAITGYSDLLLSRLANEDALRRDVHEIKSAATRAASITHQLLAFSRRNPFRPDVFDLRGVVRGIEPTLRRMLGDNVELLIELPDEAAYVKAEVSQIEQIMINLAVNAREAMPSGGRLYVTVENRASESLDRASLSSPDSWIQMTVRDTGWGIKSSVLPRIFEPFFTTKGPDEGPGLGLAIVYSLVRQCGGKIIAESQGGAGAVFRILLPRVNTPAPVSGSTEPVGGRRRTILLVEDQDFVRAVTRRLLEAAGYQVIDSANAGNALNVVQDQLNTLDLLLTDVVMPEMSGVELAEQVAMRRPELPVLYMSGFTRDEVLHDARNNRPAQFLQKPFSRDQLITGVRDAMAASAS
jgi:CheY-like chemotaxis protein/two-component sensor histidine kinase